MPDPAKLATVWFERMLAEGEVAKFEPELMQLGSEERTKAGAATERPALCNRKREQKSWLT